MISQRAFWKANTPKDWARVMHRWRLYLSHFIRPFSSSPERDNDKGRYHVLTFPPRQAHPQVREMTVWIDKETLLIQKISSQDHLGNVTLLSFKNQRMNRSLDKNTFAFVPPKGTEIIN